MSKRKLSTREVIEPEFYAIHFELTPLLYRSQGWDYVQQVEGKILLLEGLDQDLEQEQEKEQVIDHLGRSAVLAGRIALTCYDLERACADGVKPIEIFEAAGPAAMELYQQLFEGDELHRRILSLLADDGMINPSLWVLDSVEILPQYRRRRLGLAAVLKALQVFGPSGGAAVLRALPLPTLPAVGREDQAIDLPYRQKQMRMEEFESDPALAHCKLTAYWSRLGFKPLAETVLMVCSLGKILPGLTQILGQP